MGEGTLDLDQRYRIQPQLRRCLLASTQIVLSLTIILLVIIGADLALQDDRPPQNWNLQLLEVLVFAPIGILAFGAFLLGAGRALAVTATPGGLIPPSLIGSRLIVPWQAVAGVTRKAFHGVPTIFVCTTISRRAVVIFTFCLDHEEVYARLAQLAGPSHALTLSFAPDHRR